MSLIQEQFLSYPGKTEMSALQVGRDCLKFVCHNCNAQRKYRDSALAKRVLLGTSVMKDGMRERTIKA